MRVERREDDEMLHRPPNPRLPKLVAFTQTGIVRKRGNRAGNNSGNPTAAGMCARARVYMYAR